MIDGRLVAGYLRLACLGHPADQDAEISDLLARLRDLVLARVGEAARGMVNDGRLGQEALAIIAGAIEEAGRNEPAFEREVSRLCAEIARRGIQPPPWPSRSVACVQCGRTTRAEHSFCDHCGAFLEWEVRAPTAAPRSSEAPGGEPQHPALSAPTAPDTDSEQVAGAPYLPEVPMPRALRRPRAARGRTRITPDGSTRLEASGSSESSRQRAQATIDHALSTYVQRGRLLFNAPEQMREGRKERVQVAIAQHGGLDSQLRALAPGGAEAAIDDVETTPFMEVDLQGSAFSIVSLQAGGTAEQLLRPTALWQFDVTPERRGVHLLQLRVAMRIPLADRDERVSLPALERTIRVRVDAAYVGRRFVREHWQWIGATLAGLGGAVGAWIKLIQN